MVGNKGVDSVRAKPANKIYRYGLTWYGVHFYETGQVIYFPGDVIKTVWNEIKNLKHINDLTLQIYGFSKMMSWVADPVPAWVTPNGIEIMGDILLSDEKEGIFMSCGCNSYELNPPERIFEQYKIFESECFS